MNANKTSLLDVFLDNIKIRDPFPTLYSRTSTGAVQTWQVEVEGNKYRFHTGRKFGKIVTSEWTSCKGKNLGKTNETSGDSQALKEARAALKKKLKSNYWENESDIDKSKFFSPMLAHKFITLNKDGSIKKKRSIDWSKGVYVSPKMDGLRCIIKQDGSWSRLGNKFAAFPHIREELEILFKEFPGLILDGECYTHTLKHDFDKIISLAKKQTPSTEEIKESKNKLEYWVFDCPSLDGGYDERYKWLKKNIEERFGEISCIKLCRHTLIFSEIELEDYLSKFLEQGFEGCMMNIPNGEYEVDKRSYNILKYKLFQDKEFEIVDIVEGDGNRSGMFGRAILKLKDGRTFKAGARGNKAFFKRLFLEREDIIGKKATVRFQNYTPDGIPRFATIIAIRDYE